MILSFSYSCNFSNGSSVFNCDAAHNSAGPKMDIVLEEDGQKTGFLAETVEEYAEAILEIVKMNETERLKMAESARKRAARFSEQRFCEDFKTAIRPIFTGPLK